jgi:hypothetical protein
MIYLVAPESEELGQAKSAVEYALGVDAGYLKKTLGDLTKKLDGIQLLLFLAAAGGVSAAVATLMRRR